jgi:hypothetical protein
LKFGMVVRGRGTPKLGMASARVISPLRHFRGIQQLYCALLVVIGCARAPDGMAETPVTCGATTPGVAGGVTPKLVRPRGLAKFLQLSKRLKPPNFELLF